MISFYKFESGKSGREILQELGYNVPPNSMNVTPSEAPENYPRHTEPDNKNLFPIAFLGEMGRLIFTSSRDPVILETQGKLEAALDKLGISSFG